jgi:sporulation protein YlmC with PRC-barrel domain
MNPHLLKGKLIVGTEGYTLGEFHDVGVDLESWRVPSFSVLLSDEATAELNFKKPFMRKIMVCLPTQLIQAIGDVITLTEPVRNLRDIAEKELYVNPVKLEGKKVVSVKGYVVGTVEGLDVDPDNWQVDGLQVGLTDSAATELGFETPFLSKVVVIIPSYVVKEVGNFIILDKAIVDLKALVECIKSCKKRTA